MSRKDAEFAAIVAALCFFFAALFVWVGVAWPAMLSGYQGATGSGGGGGTASNSFTTMNAPSGTDPVAGSSSDTLNFTASGIVSITGTASTNTLDFSATEVDGSTTNELQNIFQSVTTTSGTSPLVAATTTDTLNLAGTSPVTVTGNSTTDTATFSLVDVTPDCSAGQFVSAVGANLALTCAQPGNVTGNAATATALAADPANCTNANDFARGVLASGVAECAQPAFSNLSGTAAVTQGGTGLTTVAQGDLLYANAANSLLALGKSATATRYLANTGTSNSPAWDQVNLTNGVTGTLPVGKGGTGITTVAQGAVLYASALDTVAGLAKNATATRYLANTGASNAPAWDQVNLSNGITGTLPLANITDDATASKCLLSGGSGGDPAWTTCPSGGGSLMDVKYYTSGTTNWTKPSNAVTVHVWCIGGGGGGGAGYKGSSGSAAGGAGGGSGGIAEAWFVAADLASPVSVSIGASVSGGAGSSTGGATANAGTNGNSSTFGSYLTAGGGFGGGGGQAAIANAGVGGNGIPWNGRSGASNVGTTGTNAPNCPTGFTAGTYSAGSGGAGGGGHNTNIYGGGDGGDACISGTAKGAGGSNSAYGNAGGAGTSASASTKYGGGGGGGGTGGNASTSGGTGGAGGAPGGGGGGGGACTTGGACTSGSGGSGAAGACVVETYG